VNSRQSLARSAHRRPKTAQPAAISFRITFFADPHGLTPIESHSYENDGVASPLTAAQSLLSFSTAAHKSHTIVHITSPASPMPSYACARFPSLGALLTSSFDQLYPSNPCHPEPRVFCGVRDLLFLFLGSSGPGCQQSHPQSFFRYLIHVHSLPISSLRSRLLSCPNSLLSFSSTGNIILLLAYFEENERSLRFPPPAISSTGHMRR
jgi:hypothetical protein